MTDFQILRDNDALRKRNAFLVRERDTARALLREMVGIFRVSADGHEQMLTLGDWGDLNPQAQAVLRIVRAYLAEVDNGE